MADRYFVTVRAGNPQDIRALRRYGFDLFAPTAKEVPERKQVERYQIEGLLTLEEVRRLVHDGYVVVIQATEAKRVGPRQPPVEAQQWLRNMGEKV